MRTEFCDARAIGKASRSSQPLKRCARTGWAFTSGWRSEEHTSELQSRSDLVCRLLLEKKKKHSCTNRLGLRLFTYASTTLCMPRSPGNGRVLCTNNERLRRLHLKSVSARSASASRICA